MLIYSCKYHEKMMREIDCEIIICNMERYNYEQTKSCIGTID